MSLKVVPLTLLVASFFAIGSPQIDEQELMRLCSDCKLTAQSVDNLIRKPRQTDSHTRIEDQINLDKIKKTVCRELVQDDERESCRRFFTENLDLAEKWKLKNPKMTYHDFVCIKELKYCCPEASFGPKCTKCTKCADNEHCHGEGTRAGNGSCVCREGHAGQNCGSCSPGYYLEKSPFESEDKSRGRSSCKKCHRSCQFCRQAGPQGCEVCRKGFHFVPGYGCSDIDECIESKNKICGDNTFCVNTEGSYFCYECDRACDGCHGDGPDMCLRCANGYKLENGNCVATRRTILPPEANYYRYAIYLGLCICTCIIFHNNVYLASLIGLCVALYIGASEYLMSGHQTAIDGMKAHDKPMAHSFSGHYYSHVGL